MWLTAIIWLCSGIIPTVLALWSVAKSLRQLLCVAKATASLLWICLPSVGWPFLLAGFCCAAGGFFGVPRVVYLSVLSAAVVNGLHYFHCARVRNLPFSTTEMWHRVPGLCYLVLFKREDRWSVFKAAGLYPRWGELCALDFDMMNRYYDFDVTDAQGQGAHVWDSPRGVGESVSLDELGRLFPAERRLGGASQAFVVIPVMRLANVLAQLARFAVVVLVIINMPLFHAMAAVPAYLGAVYYGLPTVAVFGWYVCTATFDGGAFWTRLLGALMWYGIRQTTVWASYALVDRMYCIGKWNIPDPPAVVKDSDYLQQNGLPERPNVQYDPSFGNPHHTRKNLVDEDGVSRRDLQVFKAETNIDVTSTRSTGNPHGLAAMCSRYLRRLIEIDNDLTRHFVVVGGTFAPWSKAATGVALQPLMVGGDAHRLANGPSDPALSQTVLNRSLAVDAGSVGDDVRNWTAKWNVTGVEGAVFAMVDVYDVNLKSFLGAATENQSTSAYVVMQGCPDVFRKKVGRLPWSGQWWKHMADGTTQWYWTDTSGAGFSHNTRAYHEHFWTTSVQTAPGVYWVSEVPRQVMDKILVRWTVQYTKPEPVVADRTFKVSLPFGLYDSPTMDYYASGYGVCEFSSLRTSVQHNEYMNESKTYKAGRVNSRALTDAFSRIEDKNSRHFTEAQSMSLYNAEGMRRYLLDVAMPGETTWGGVMSFMGLAEDSTLTRHTATKALNMLTDQPAYKVDLPTMAQEEAYMKPVEARIAPVARLIPLRVTMETTAGAIYTQQAMDREPADGVRLLVSTGESDSSRLLYALFGKHNLQVPILPLGEMERGGSYLSLAGTKLLKCEVAWMLETMNVVIVVRHGDTRATFGNQREERPVIVVINGLGVGDIVRVHYPLHAKASTVIASFNAPPADLQDQSGWIDLFTGTPRHYEVHPNGAEVNRTMRVAMISEDLRKARDGAERRLRAELAAVVPMPLLHIPVGATVAEIDIMRCARLQPYDGLKAVEVSNLPPPHHYAAGTVENMRRLLYCSIATGVTSSNCTAEWLGVGTCVADSAGWQNLDAGGLLRSLLDVRDWMARHDPVLWCAERVMDGSVTAIVTTCVVVLSAIVVRQLWQRMKPRNVV